MPRTLKILFIFTAVLLVISSSYSTPTEVSKYIQLDNRLKVILVERHSTPILHIATAFNVGSKDETEKTNGLIHLLEHCILFRGTEFRSGEQVIRDIRRHGGYFNAHTGRDISIFELSLPSRFADFGLNIQKEILFHLNFSQEELDKEKEVILEEISQILDDPHRHAKTVLFQNLFSGHSYQRPIFGKKSIIQNLTSEQIKIFYKKYFVPENCVLAVVGDFSIHEMENKITKIFGIIPESGFVPAVFPQVLPLKKNREIQKEMDVNNAYMLIGTLGPNYNHSDQYGMNVLTQILGRGINPLLNSALRGRRKLVDSLFMSYASLQYGGAVTVSLTLNPKHIRSAKRETLRYLKRTRNLNYSKKDYYGSNKYYALDFLENAKNQLRFSYFQSQEKGLNIATSLARYTLINDLPERGNYLDIINRINSSALRKIAGDYLSKRKYAIVIIRPLKK